MIIPILFGSLVCASAVSAPAPAVASGPIAPPSAPGQLSVSWFGVKDPTNVSAGYEVGLQWAASATHGSPVTRYLVQRSTDGAQTWTADPGVPTTTGLQATVSDAPAGHAWLFRVIADSAAGRSAPATPVTVAVPGTGIRTQRLRFLTTDGAPITGGAVTWSSTSGKWSKSYHLNADGIVDLPNVPAGWDTSVQVAEANLASGFQVTKIWSVNTGTSMQTLLVPPPPPEMTRTVHVVMPGGTPVYGAEVDASNYNALMGTTFVDGFTYLDPSKPDGSFGLDANTDTSGTAVLHGWSNKGVDFVPPLKYPYPEQAVLVSYYEPDYVKQTSVLIQEKTALLTGADSTVVLAPMPWLSGGTPAPTDPEATAALRFVVHRAPVASSGMTPAIARSVSGVRVWVVPPAGWSARKCRTRPVLEGVTNRSGRVKLSVCGTASGVFKVKSRGAVSNGTITLRVKHTPALAPTRVTARSIASGQLVVTWSRPAYAGGATVQAYRITLKAPGQKARSITLRSAALKSGRVHTFRNLKRAVHWTVSVRAITRYGAGASRSASALTR